MQAISVSPIPLLPRTPSLMRRLSCMLYEAVILFGVIFIAALAFGMIAQQRNGMSDRQALAAWICLVVGGYFVWFWSKGRQTLPMKTWHIQVRTANGRALTPLHAALRFAVCWLWWLPPLTLHRLIGLPIAATLGALAIWVMAWAAAQWLDPQRQFLHDRLIGTRLFEIIPEANTPATPEAQPQTS